MRTLILLSLFLSIHLIQAQTTQDSLQISSDTTEEISLNKKYPASIGFGGGSTTGMGISMRYWPGKFGFMVNMFPRFNNDGYVFNIGGALKYELKETEWVRIFSYLSYNYYEEYFHYDFYYYDDPSRYETHWDSGVGVGLDHRISKRGSFVLMTGLGFYHGFKIISGSVDLGLYYKF